VVIQTQAHQAAVEKIIAPNFGERKN
jgi:hypothetical protein